MNFIFSVSSGTPDSSESSDQEHLSRNSRTKLIIKQQQQQQQQVQQQAVANLRKKFGNSLPHPPPHPLASSMNNPFSMKHVTQEMFSTISAKQRTLVENNFLHDDESSLDVSSPREINSPSFGLLTKNKDCQDKLTKKRDKQKAKEDEKIEKRRLKVSIFYFLDQGGDLENSMLRFKNFSFFKLKYFNLQKKLLLNE